MLSHRNLLGLELWNESSLWNSLLVPYIKAWHIMVFSVCLNTWGFWLAWRDWFYWHVKLWRIGDILPTILKISILWVVLNSRLWLVLSPIVLDRRVLSRIQIGKRTCFCNCAVFISRWMICSGWIHSPKCFDVLIHFHMVIIVDQSILLSKVRICD